MQDLLKEPNWRPRFHYYHMGSSFAGAILCLFIMFATSPYFALGAIFFVAVLYKYVEYRKVRRAAPRAAPRAGPRARVPWRVYMRCARRAGVGALGRRPAWSALPARAADAACAREVRSLAHEELAAADPPLCKGVNDGVSCWCEW